MAFCLLRDDLEENIIQSLGHHGKDRNISMADIVCRFSMSSVFCLNEIIIGSQEPTSRNCYSLPLNRANRAKPMLLRYTGCKKSEDYE